MNANSVFNLFLVSKNLLMSKFVIHLSEAHLHRFCLLQRCTISNVLVIVGFSMIGSYFKRTLSSTVSFEKI